MNLENKLWHFLQSLSPRTHEVVWKYRFVGKYIVAGGTAATTNLLFLYFFTAVVGLWYVFSAVLAFIIAFVVSFCLQKFWTFEDHSTESVHAQAAFYLVVATINLCLNTALIYVLVEYFAIHYLLAQIMTGTVIACESFFVYRRFIFRPKQP